jgi:hypothetical protein
MGKATGLIVTATDGYDLTNGTSIVTANFATARADISVSDFRVTDQLTGNETTAPLDKIAVDDAIISGSTVIGGTVTITRGTQTVALTGANTTSDVSGAFFGYDMPNSRPDEVAGFILVQGSGGIITSRFIAD